jgi:predicted nucleotide-binding protein
LPRDPATQRVLDALHRSRGRGERQQGLRTVSGLAGETGLPAEEVERVLASHPELFVRARRPDRHGNALYKARGSADAGSQPLSGDRTSPTQAAPAHVAHEPKTEGPAASPPDVPGTAPIFVVHGHDHAVLHHVVRVLERTTSRPVTVLHEQANAGRTTLEKFEEHAVAASYAVVLLTGDDEGSALGGTPKPRGRQNVIFELGFFFGKLGRHRVAVLLAPGVEQPSDIAGLVYIAMDGAGAWKYELARELEAAGIPVAREHIP